MRVLDVGSGVGDVAILAGRIVGTAGSVTACDLDEKALAVLRERAASEGLANISTLAGDLHTLALPHDINAVTGRHILIHLPDPLAIVRLVSGLVKPGGGVVFQEYDFSVMHAGFPRHAIAGSDVRGLPRLLRQGTPMATWARGSRCCLRLLA